MRCRVVFPFILKYLSPETQNLGISSSSVTSYPHSRSLYFPSTCGGDVEWRIFDKISCDFYVWYSLIFTTVYLIALLTNGYSYLFFPLFCVIILYSR